MSGGNWERIESERLDAYVLSLPRDRGNWERIESLYHRCRGFSIFHVHVLEATGKELKGDQLRRLAQRHDAGEATGKELKDLYYCPSRVYVCDNEATGKELKVRPSVLLQGLGIYARGNWERIESGAENCGSHSSEA